MVLAEWPTAFREEALSLEVLLAAGTVEALTVVVVVQGLHPLVAGLDGEPAGEALGREQFVPVGFAVGIALLQEERAVAEQFAAVGTLEALRVELLPDGVQTITLHSGVALAADGGQELFEAVFTVQVTLFLHESNVSQRAFAVAVVADKVVRTPDATEGGDEGTSDLLTAAATQWNTATGGHGLVHNTTTTSWGGGRTGSPSLVEYAGTLLSWHSSRGGYNRDRSWSDHRWVDRRLGSRSCNHRSCNHRSWSRSMTGDGSGEGSWYTAGYRWEGRWQLNLGQVARRQRTAEWFRNNVALVVGGVRGLRATVQIGMGVEGCGDGLDSRLLSGFGDRDRDHSVGAGWWTLESRQPSVDVAVQFVVQVEISLVL